MTTMGSMWYLESTNLYDIFCPHKLAGYQETYVSRKLRKGEFIYFPEDPSSMIYLVAEGKVKILYYTDSGEEVTKSVLSKGEIFGELALLGEEKRKDYAVSMKDETLICQVTIDQMRGLMADDDAFALRINKLIGFRIRKLERKLDSLVFKDVRTRLLEFLKDFAMEQGEQDGHAYNVRYFLTHKDIADLVGTTRQTVTTLLNDFRNEGVIEFTRKSIYVSDIRKLDGGNNKLLRSA